MSETPPQNPLALGRDAQVLALAFFPLGKESQMTIAPSRIFTPRTADAMVELLQKGGAQRVRHLGRGDIYMGTPELGVPLLNLVKASPGEGYPIFEQGE